MLIINEVYTNDKVREAFGCSLMSGMNKSNKTNTLVLILKHIDNIYDDKQEDDIIFYTGKGQKGNQELTRENKILAESGTNGVSVVLFEVFNKSQYTYRGDVTLIADPFTEIQLDVDNNKRNVFVFPLKLRDAQELPILKEIYDEATENKVKKIHKLSDEDLDKRLKYSQNEKPGYIYTKVKNYQRSTAVIEKVQRRAKGICELCMNPAPFLKKNKTPYLEVHHVIHLAKGGADTVKNAVALCPNCHRKMHSLDLETDRKRLLSIP